MHTFSICKCLRAYAEMYCTSHVYITRFNYAHNGHLNYKHLQERLPSPISTLVHKVSFNMIEKVYISINGIKCSVIRPKKRFFIFYIHICIERELAE